MLSLIALRPSSAQGSGSLQLGVGAHYWRALDNLDVEQVDQSGVVWLLSGRYQAAPAFGIGMDIEQFPKGFAASRETLYAPALLILLGRRLYAGIGAGLYLTDAGRYSGSPFYVMRGGFMFSPLPSIILDLHANYRYDTWDSLSATARNIDTDTITLGAALRLAL